MLGYIYACCPVGVSARGTRLNIGLQNEMNDTERKPQPSLTLSNAFLSSPSLWKISISNAVPPTPVKTFHSPPVLKRHYFQILKSENEVTFIFALGAHLLLIVRKSYSSWICDSSGSESSSAFSLSSLRSAVSENVERFKFHKAM